MTTALSTLLKHFPRARASLKRLHDAIRYVEIGSDEVVREEARLSGAWHANVLPRRQRQLVDRQLADFRRGAPVDVFDVMVKALRQLPESADGMSLLEVGCSSGYYAEVLEIAGMNIAYAGCDFSNAFIAMARQKNPTLRFDVEDATALSFKDDAFDIVVSGCCLLHIPEYERAVAQAARVSRRYAIFHRTPVVMGQPERRFRKLAYGVEMVENPFQ